MAYRGGRGRGRGGFFKHNVKEEKYEIFPASQEIKKLPDVNLKEKDELKCLVAWSNDLEKFWKSSPYRIEEGVEKNGSIIRKPPLSDYMMLTDDYVPAELVAKNVRRSKKKVRWDPQSELQKLDAFEKLDHEPQEGEDNDDKDKKEDEDEDEDDENIEEEEDDYHDDYYQNDYYDDDEDDYNEPKNGGDDEGYY